MTITRKLGFSENSRVYYHNCRKVGNHNDACYDECVAYFKKIGLNKHNILPEFYHHLLYVYDWDMKVFEEEKKAIWYSKAISKKRF
jgi:hypothetical protein